MKVPKCVCNSCEFAITFANFQNLTGTVVGIEAEFARTKGYRYFCGLESADQFASQSINICLKAKKPDDHCPRYCSREAA